MAYSYQDVSSRRTPRFRVFDGTRLLGEVQYRWFRHIRQFAWEATGADQSHRAVKVQRAPCFARQEGWSMRTWRAPVSSKARPR